MLCCSSSEATSWLLSESNSEEANKIKGALSSQLREGLQFEVLKTYAKVESRSDPFLRL